MTWTGRRRTHMITTYTWSSESTESSHLERTNKKGEEDTPATPGMLRKSRTVSRKRKITNKHGIGYRRRGIGRRKRYKTLSDGCGQA